MSTPSANPRVEEIDDVGCRALLDGQHVGRVAYVVAGEPMIVPVDYEVFQDMIVFRSDPGDKLSHIPLTKVCFEVDGSDGANVVWSVIVHGAARDVTTALNEEYEQMRKTRVPTFATLLEPHWLTIEIDRITGRRLSR